VPNRHQDSKEYRYGFQGQEKDDELKGEGNSMNYTFRMHDPRVGRFFTTDPLEGKYPWYTPYQFSGNRLIDSVELEGLEEQQLNGGGGTVYGPYTSAEAGAASGAAVQLNEVVVKGSSISASKKFANMQASLASVQRGYNNEWISKGRIYNQVSSNTLTVNTIGEDNPEFKFMYPSDMGTLDTEGSDGLRWYGCASCHADNGAYRYAAYNSREAFTGRFIGEQANALMLGRVLKLMRGPKMVPKSLGAASKGFTTKWPWKKMLTAREIEVASCDADALKIQKMIGGEILTVSNPRGMQLGPVQYGKEVISGWYYHKAVFKNNMVYDRMTGPSGMHIDRYKELFEYASDLIFKI